MGDPRGRAALAALACTLLALLLPATTAAAPTAAASIIGGHSGTIEEFPSLVYIEAQEGKHGFSCTGTVVAPRVVLTAAHCVESIEEGTITPSQSYAVATGVADVREAAPENVFHIVATHVFPGFDPGILHGDAAILILDHPTAAAPIALAGSADAALYKGGAEVRLAGWGLTSAGAKGAPPDLQMTTMRVKPPSYCRQSTHPFYSPYSAAAQVCVLAADRRSGGCFGDSGGPAIGQRSDGTLVQLGITSTGGPACSTKTPTVLTRADFVSTWVSEWIAATESGAPPPLVDPDAPLPKLVKESAEEFAVYTLTSVMGKRFERAREVLGSCRTSGPNRARCQVSWVTGGNIFAANVSPFYVRRQEAVAWDSHYRIEWARLKCISHSAHNRRCRISAKRG